eukprot:Sspe_Gene.46695::Locus_23403_Transcript_1_1_Confidence_1.000_Length_973::g.46695::m.46695
MDVAGLEKLVRGAGGYIGFIEGKGRAISDTSLPSDYCSELQAQFKIAMDALRTMLREIPELDGTSQRAALLQRKFKRIEGDARSALEAGGRAYRLAQSVSAVTRNRLLVAPLPRESFRPPPTPRAILDNYIPVPSTPSTPSPPSRCVRRSAPPHDSSSSASAVTF